MDILIHFLFIVVIGLFFFLDKFTKTQNSMFIIIILSFLGFILIQNGGGVQLVDYNSFNETTINSSLVITEYNNIDLSNKGMGLFNITSFFVLVYWFFMILSSINLFLGKKEN